MKTSAFFVVALGALGACFINGCTLSPNATDSSSSDDLSADDDSSASDADAVTVADGTITFPASSATSQHAKHAAFRMPQFLVGNRASNAVLPDGTIDPNSKNPNGYLRKVTGMTTLADGSTQFTTEPASLVEAQAHSLVKQDASGSSDCFPAASNAFNIYHLDLSKNLYTKQFGSIGSMKIGFTNSSLDISGSIDTEVTGRCLSPTSAKAVLNLNLKGQVVLEGDFDGAFGAETGTVPLYHQQIAITSVAGYPLALDFTVSADCEFESNGKASASVGTTINGSISAGGTWASGQGFSTVFTPSWPQVDAVGPNFNTNATVGGKCTLSAKAQALVFDSTQGPYATANAYLQLDATGSGNGSADTDSAAGTVEAKLTAGADIGLGGSLKPFDYTIIDNINEPLYSQSWQIFDQTYSVSDGTSPSQPTTPAADPSQSSSDSSDDSDQ